MCFFPNNHVSTCYINNSLNYAFLVVVLGKNAIIACINAHVYGESRKFCISATQNRCLTLPSFFYESKRVVFKLINKTFRFSISKKLHECSLSYAIQLVR